MSSVADNLHRVRARIAAAEKAAGRPPGSVALLAVSKTKPVGQLREAVACGQRAFGESYLQEALHKIEALRECDLEWHFIGPVQSNKTRAIAEHFHWVHSVDRIKIARRLSQQRPAALPALNICLQINIDAEPSKSGFAVDELRQAAHAVAELPHLRLRGLMAIPRPRENADEQRQAFRRLNELKKQLLADGLDLDTLSMGMSGDLEAAVAEGSTLVRIGTDIFGAREPQPVTST